MKMRKAVAFFQVLVLLVCLLPMLKETAFAYPTVISVGGTALGAGEYLPVGGNTPVKYKPAQGGYAYYTGYTLYLNDFSYTGTTALGIGSSGDLRIEVTGTNTFSTGNYNTVYAGGRLLIYGDGVLHGDTGNVPAIYSVGDMTVSGGTLLLQTMAGNVINARSNLSVVGGSIEVAAKGNYAAINVRGDMNVSGGSVAADAFGSSQAIHVVDCLTQSGGIITANAVAGNSLLCNVLQIAGGDVEVSSDGKYPTLCVMQDLSISDGRLKALANGAGDAVQVGGDLVQTGGKIFVQSSNADGILLPAGKAVISGGETDVSAARAGIYAEAVTVCGVLTVRSTEETNDEDYCALECNAATFTIDEGFRIWAATGHDSTLGAYDASRLSEYDLIAVRPEEQPDDRIDVPVVSISTNASSGKPVLKWDEVEGAVKYDIYRSTTYGGPYTKYHSVTTTSFTNTTPKAGDKYYYKIVAVSEEGDTSAASNIVTIYCDCAQPVVSISTNASSGKPVLKWAAVAGATGYEIYRSTSYDGPYSKYYTTTSTSFTNTTPKAGDKYYYKIRAIVDGNASANSAYSKAVAIYCDLAQPVVSINLNGSGKPTLAWEAVDGATGYEIWRCGTQNGTYSRYYTTAGTTFTNSAAGAGKQYFYKVRAIMEGNSSANSAYSEIRTIVCGCAAPIVNIGSNAASGKPTLSWEAVEGAVKYDIYRSTSYGGPYTKYHSVTTTSYTNTTPKAGDKYYYKVVAVNGAGFTSAYSNIVTMYCDCAQPVVSISLNGSGKPTLTWKAVDGATGYEIWRCGTQNGTYSKYYTTTSTTFTNSAVGAGQQYFYKVRAIVEGNSSANSAYSSIVTIKAK